MRALVLSGGEGSRLRPITHTNAKQLIPIANTPILFHVLSDVRDAGIREVGIVVGQTEAEIRAAVGDGSAWGLSVTYIPQEAPLGLAHAVLTARDFVAGEPFLMYLGDNVLLEGIGRFVEEFERNRPDAQIFLARVPEPERFGVAMLEGDRVVRLVEKPSEHISDLALVGVYLFDDQVLEAARAIEPSWRGELEITDAIQWLIDHGRTVRAEMVGGWWKDTGRPEDLLEANRMMLSTLEPRAARGRRRPRARREGRRLDDRGSRDRGSRHAHRGLHRRPARLDLRGVRDPCQRRRRLDRDGGLSYRGRAGHRGLDPRARRGGASRGRARPAPARPRRPEPGRRRLACRACERSSTRGRPSIPVGRGSVTTRSS
jgi:glucose-1-phosphate thymidylyltransferase